ncbi:MAG: twin-arginine translocase TatA/TatE family subunit [Verrucomicrobia bacterium]|nr:twin-arginine translocase TatA/TatE family subunit [Verrucomicrobiota bacterium]
MYMLAFGAPGPSEWMLILIIVLVLFGAKRLPELARSLGQSMNEFRKAREEFDRELQQAANDVKGTTTAQPPRTYTQAPQVAAPVQPAAQVQPAPGTQPVQPRQPEPPQGTASTAGTPQTSDPGRPLPG